VWKVVETNTEKVRVEKTEGGGSKRGSKKETGGKE